MGERFCGWYFKCQSPAHTLALIPAVHTRGGRRRCSLQIITDEGAWETALPGEGAVVEKDRPWAVLGENIFSPEGIRLDLKAGSLRAEGSLRFGAPQPLKYDIMGPFCLVPFMECRHRVFSMVHRVDGRIVVAGRAYSFENGTGYIEGDRGYAFPSTYAWTQCCFPGGSLMLAVARIPLGPGAFTGIVGVVLLGGKEYRVATYLGARLVSMRDGKILVRQRGLELQAVRMEDAARPLRAPTREGMTRLIRENVSCRAAYSLKKDGRTLWELEVPNAAFEYECPQ